MKFYLALICVLLLISQSDAWWSRRRHSPAPDTTPPAITCPSLGTQYSTTSTATVTWAEPTCTDTRSSCTVTRIAGGAPGSQFSEGSHHTVTYRAVDRAGNDRTCSFTFSVVVIQCTALEVPSNGIVSCTNGRSVGSVCYYSCNTGFDLLSGSSASRTCVRSGNSASWSASTPSCTNTSPPDITCPSLGTQYTITPTATVTWAQPTCVDTHSSCSLTRTTGGAPGAQFAEGFHTVTYSTEDTTGNEQTCSFSFSVVVIQCSVLEVPSDGIVSCANGESVGSVCHFSCNMGYDLSGSEDRTCVRSGNSASWSGFTTSCTRTSCPATLTSPNHGEVQCTDLNFFNSICSYTCDPDYILTSGNTQRICTDSGWTGTSAKCQDTGGTTSIASIAQDAALPVAIVLVLIVVVVIVVVKRRKRTRNQQKNGDTNSLPPPPPPPPDYDHQFNHVNYVNHAYAQ